MHFSTALAQVRHKCTECRGWFLRDHLPNHSCNPRFISGFIIERICVTVRNSDAIRKLGSGSTLLFYLKYDGYRNYRDALLGTENKITIGPFRGDLVYKGDLHRLVYNQELGDLVCQGEEVNIYEMNIPQVLNKSIGTLIEWTVVVGDPNAKIRASGLHFNVLGGTDDTDLPVSSKRRNYFTYWDTMCPIIDDDVKTCESLLPHRYHLGTGGRAYPATIAATICCRVRPLGAYANYIAVNDMLSAECSNKTQWTRFSILPFEMVQVILDYVLNWLGERD